MKVSLICSILFPVLFSTCDSHTYSGYVVDSDNLQPVDNLLITDNPETAYAWIESGMSFPDDGTFCLFTDSNGFFSFKRSRDFDDYDIFFIKKGYMNKCCRQGMLDGDTICISPDWETTKMREEDKKPKYITSVHQLPLQIGDVKFIRHDVQVSVCVTDTSIPLSQTYNAVYIDENRKSAKYEQVINFQLSDEYYFPPLDTIRNRIPASLSRRWVQLEQYENEYYIYLPADRNVMRYEITEIALISFGWMDGDYGFTYNGIEQHNDHYIIKGGYRGGFVLCDELHIYTVDSSRGLAVFEKREDGKIMGRSLFVNASKARQFPLIVHEYDGTMIFKPTYYPLDEIDFDRLLMTFKDKD